MAEKDYYAVLGVDRAADLPGIQRAFRKLAKQHHPDYVGAGGTRYFQELVEAYEILSDHDKRAQYNHDLWRAERAARLRTRSAGRPWMEPEPLVNRPGRATPRSSRLRARLDMELRLSPADAVAGTRVGVPLPVSYGTHFVHGELILTLDIPPGVRDGAVLTVPLDALGLAELDLRLHVRIVRPRW